MRPFSPLAFLLTGLMGATLAGCQSTPAAGPGLLPSDGRTHAEPVFYNGERYQVTFNYKGGTNAYDVAVERRGRALKDAQKDRETAVEVARSALTHFACPNGQKAKPIDSATNYAARRWRITARCA